MPAITLIVTNAGRAALVNAAQAGTYAVRIAAAGLTATNFAPVATAVVLPGEFARINGVAGAAVDPATISLVIRDDSAAAYTLRGLGLFLADGTLFAIYGQPGAILEKTATSTALIVLDVRFADIDATNLTFGDANFLNPPATTEVEGVVELATPAEAIAGLDAVRAITPATLKALIDNRFGAAAASAFVRTLLTAATAAAFRLVLGIKSAALKDEGSGNGLDADLLDGYQLRAGANGHIWPGIPLIGAGGGMEVGQYLDFHSIPDDPADYAVRLQQFGANLYATSNIIWTAGNDGAGSGLDADLLDGQDGSWYANIPARLGYTPYNLASVPYGFGGQQSGGLALSSEDPDAYVIGSSYFTFHPNNGYGGGDAAYLVTLGGGDVAGRGFQLSARYNTGDLMLRSRPAGWTRIWTAGNDGSGSGLDADFLDGRDSNFFYPASNPSGFISGFNGAQVVSALGYTPWHASNDGAGSGLDADLLDGRDAASFANASHQHIAADIAPAFANASLGTSGYQALPGGLLIQWGQVRAYRAGEGAGPYVPFPTPFAEAAWSVTATSVNPGASISRDSVVQITNRDANGFNTFYQGEGAGGDNTDGFDWIAIGRY